MSHSPDVLLNNDQWAEIVKIKESYRRVGEAINDTEAWEIWIRRGMPKSD